MSRFDLARRFLPYVKNYRGQVAVSISLTLLTVLMSVIKPLPLKILFDNVIGNLPVPSILQPIYAAMGQQRSFLLFFVSASVMGIAALAAVTNYFGESRVKNLGLRILFDLRRDLYTHMQGLPLSFYEKQRTGDLVARLTSDLQLVQEMVVSNLFTLLTNVFILVGMILVMLSINWNLTLIALAVMPLMFYVIHFYTHRIGQLSRVQRKAEGHAASIAQETLSSMRVVQAYTAENHEMLRFEGATKESLQSSLRSSRLQAAFTGVVGLVIALGTSAIIYMGAVDVNGGSMTVGDLVVFLLYLSSMYTPMRKLSKLTNGITKAAAAAERIIEILDMRSTVFDASDAQSLGKAHGDVKFDHVNFNYDPERPVLQDICFEARHGEKIAIVGSTGAGKSTIMSLLLRFYDPTAGSISIDGLDLRAISLASLRSQVSIVLQEAVIFRASIWENIAYGRAEAVMSEVVAAAKAAQAHEFISRLPYGYFTIVGERGATLSGGERQRIAIARAILRDSPIVVLDEPTTGLDAESEAMVLRAIEELAKNRTTFMITHRLSIVRQADLILVIERGRIVESGTHEDLLRSSGRYSTLYQMQLLASPLPLSPKGVGDQM